MTKICFDVGGTILKAAAVTNGNIGEIISVPARSNESSKIILQNFCGVIDRLAAGCTEVIDGLRFAFPGDFDYENGICLIKAVNKYEAIYKMNLKEYFFDYMQKNHLNQLSKNFSCKFVNDVSAVALGAASSYGDIQHGKAIVLCIGTGCGSAYLNEGKIVTEGVGVPENGWVYPLAFKDKTFDEYLSVRGFKALSLKLMGDEKDGYTVAMLAKEDNKKAKLLLESFAENIGYGIKLLAKEYKPSVFMLGGGIMKSYEFLSAPIKKATDECGIKTIVADDTSKLAVAGLDTI